MNYLSGYFRCDYDDTRVNILDHPSIKWTRYEHFCSKVHAGENCNAHIAGLCSGSNIAKSLRHNCSQNIAWAQQYVSATSQTAMNSLNLFQSMKAKNYKFLSFANCQVTERKKFAKCYQKLKRDCSHRKVVAMKVLRMTPSSLGDLLQKHPDLHVIRLIRDPRAVVASRLKISHYYRDTLGSPVQEAIYFCKRMAADLQQIQALRLKYPGAISEIKYEDYVQNVSSGIVNIYKQIGLKVHDSVFDWLRWAGIISEKHRGHDLPFSVHRSNWTEPIDKWKVTLENETDRQQITMHCRTILEKYNYDLKY